MSDPAANELHELHEILVHGAGAADATPARLSLGLSATSEDKLFARALVQAVAHECVPALPEAPPSQPPAAGDAESARAAEGEPPGDDEPGPVTASRAFTTRAPAPSLSIARLDDIRTLLLVVRAGSFFQRRESVRRIGELLSSSSTQLASDLRRQALDTLTRLQHTELAHEIGVALARLPGGEGRAARADQRTRAERAGHVEARIVAFWDGEESEEPLTQLAPEERAQLLLRLRGLPDLLARHVGALLEDAQVLGQAPLRRMLLSSLEHSGDPRLLPALRSQFLMQDAETFDGCVRALASIEDPRVLPLLRDAYERAARSRDRLLLGAALGCQGDSRGLGLAREALAAQTSGDPALVPPALELLAELGGSEDIQRVTELLDHPEETAARAAIRALGRIGDGRALAPLAALRARAQSSALRAQIEDAELSIHARVELLGEEAPSQQATHAAWDTNKMVARVRARDPATVRVRARLYHFFAYLWLLCGAQLRAIARFEAAAALRPEWIAPVLALALLYARSGQIPQALAAFRRAVDIDRYELEADGHAITALAQTFLRRAEAMEREGRLDIARSLVEEVLSYDLRKAVAEVRFALQERLELQIARESGWKP
ncbi:MAG TPA: hypothetical protein VJV78_09735 [Polyangiales bacterium]|nr:hypothetical protein [Polyangiales bacterium]